MKIIERYIAKQLISMVLLVAVALLGVDLFFYLINELRFVGQGNYGILQALMFVGLTIPRKLYIMFHWSALLGSLLALGNLARNNELVAMRAAAISIHTISKAALKGALLLAVLVVCCGEVIAPVTERMAQQKKTQALSSGQATQTEFGIWVRDENEFLHVGHMVGGDIKQVTKYTFDKELNLQESLFAERAYPVKDGWALENVTGTKFLAQHTKAFKQDKIIVPKLLKVEILQASQVKHLERLSIKHLQHIIQQREANDLNVQIYQVALWNKIFQPLAVIVMVYLGIPFVFGPLKRASTGLKLLTGVLVGFGFHVVHSIFVQLPTVINLAPAFAMAIPSLIFFAVGFTLLSRVR